MEAIQNMLKTHAKDLAKKTLEISQVDNHRHCLILWSHDGGAAAVPMRIPPTSSIAKYVRLAVWDKIEDPTIRYIGRLLSGGFVHYCPEQTPVSDDDTFAAPYFPSGESGPSGLPNGQPTAAREIYVFGCFAGGTPSCRLMLADKTERGRRMIQRVLRAYTEGPSLSRSPGERAQVYVYGLSKDCGVVPMELDRNVSFWKFLRLATWRTIRVPSFYFFGVKRCDGVLEIHHRLLDGDLRETEMCLKDLCPDDGDSMMSFIFAAFDAEKSDAKQLFRSPEIETLGRCPQIDDMLMAYAESSNFEQLRRVTKLEDDDSGKLGYGAGIVLTKDGERTIFPMMLRWGDEVVKYLRLGAWTRIEKPQIFYLGRCCEGVLNVDWRKIENSSLLSSFLSDAERANINNGVFKTEDVFYFGCVEEGSHSAFRYPTSSLRSLEEQDKKRLQKMLFGYTSTSTSWSSKTSISSDSGGVQAVALLFMRGRCCMHMSFAISRAQLARRDGGSSTIRSRHRHRALVRFVLLE
eukprot:Selendium_serpulae@DN6447_c2_g3_i13.p1